MDDLEEMLELREEFEEKGLTFYIHVDAAWGGYFASVLRSKDGKHLNAVITINATLFLKMRVVIFFKWAKFLIG